MDAMDAINDDSDEYEYEYHESETEVSFLPKLSLALHT